MWKSSREIAEIYGMDVRTVRNLCHARGQKFAKRPVTGGRFYINEELFQNFLDRRTKA